MRNDQERAEGYFPVRTPGGEVRLPELTWGEAAEWARLSAAAFGPVFAEYEREWKPGDGMIPIDAASGRAMDTMTDRIVAYDVTDALGGRDAVRRLFGHQIRDLYTDLYESAHPFDGDLQAALVQMATLRVNATLAVQLAGLNSTSGSSQPGASRRERRARSSPPVRSATFGTRRRNGGSALPATGSPSSTPQ